MISIEKRTDYQARFDFNKPFDCVEMKYGISKEVLSELSWEKRVIVWLDYDGRLTASVLEDISYVSSCACSGSLLIVTVNSGGYKSPRGKNVEETYKILKDRFQHDAGFALPPGIVVKNLQGIEMAKTCRRLIEDKIGITLRDRNGLYSSDIQMLYRPLLNFVYQDGAQMLTVGGIFYQTKDTDILAQCKFEDLGFTTSEVDDLYHINLPIMTVRERHYIEQRLPAGACDEAISIGMKQEEIDNFVRLYRYCPSFAEVELI